jgi:uncharacterized coiled-coil protein SlyX
LAEDFMDRSWGWLPLAVCLIGCSAPASSSVATYAPTAADAPSDASVPRVGENAAEEVAPPSAGRQIIYRATIVLDVKDFAAAERQVAALVKSSGGFIAKFQEERPYGAQRGGRWTVRVPVPQFDRFVEEAGKLGVAQSRNINSEDVSEEFVDLTARLKNKQQLEARLLELVAKRSDEIKDILALEAELSRVREEIERMQGRLRYLTDRVALTTVELAAYERTEFKPPEAPTFAANVSQSFFESLDKLRQCGEAVVLLVVALVPWVLALALLAALTVSLVWLLWRITRRKPMPIVTATAI